MKWVKASERLPKDFKRVAVKYHGIICASYYVKDQGWYDSYTNRHWLTPGVEIEWLDESEEQPPQPIKTAEEKQPNSQELSDAVNDWAESENIRGRKGMVNLNDFFGGVHFGIKWKSSQFKAQQVTEEVWIRTFLGGEHQYEVRAIELDGVTYSVGDETSHGTIKLFEWSDLWGWGFINTKGFRCTFRDNPKPQPQSRLSNPAPITGETGKRYCDKCGKELILKRFFCNGELLFIGYDECKCQSRQAKQEGEGDGWDETEALIMKLSRGNLQRDALISALEEYIKWLEEHHLATLFPHKKEEQQYHRSNIEQAKQGI